MDGTKTRAFAALIVLLGALTVYTYELRFRHAAPAGTPSYESIAREGAGFVCAEEERDTEPLKLLGADATLFRTYRSASGRTIWLFIGYFAAQHENSQIHSPRHCYPGSGWNIVEEGTAPLRFGARELPVERLVIFNGAERHCVLYWFTSRDGVITNEFALKWNQMKSSLLRRSQASAFVRFSTPVEAGAPVAEAVEELAEFAEALVPSIDEALGSAGAARSGRREAPNQPEDGTRR